MTEVIEMFFPFYGFYYNSYYMIGTIFVILAAILALWAQMKVTSTYNRYRKVANARGITGAQVAREILDSEGLYDIMIYEVKGQLSDHYNPGKKTINLSSDVYHGTSVHRWLWLRMNVDMLFSIKKNMYLFL